MNENKSNGGAVLARRLARELSNEELQEVSGAGAKQTDWSVDYRTSQPGWDNLSTGPSNSGDGDYRNDAG